MKLDATGFYELDNKYSVLLNSVIDYMFIEFKDGKFSANLKFSLPVSKDFDKLELQISGIKALSLNQNVDNIGQQIHFYKFLMIDNNYYLALDPDEFSEDRTADDQDFFLFEELVADII